MTTGNDAVQAGNVQAGDVRSAVAVGLLTEAQAAGLLAHAAARAGQRAAFAADDEPFELFKGFAEIFVSLGLILLIAGLLLFSQFFGGFMAPAFAAFLCWTFALYFTRRRRMSLPSIVLVTGYALGVASAIGLLAVSVLDGVEIGRPVLVGWAVLVLLALVIWYRVFKVPFTMFLVGLTGLALVLTLTGDFASLAAGAADWTSIFDLRQRSGLAVGTLAFGLAALAAGLFFDMRDPYRLGRWSASGFWLHILAAPALVNTVALTAYNAGGLPGNLWLAAALAVFALFALVIDRRSFLTAGIGYLAVLLGWALRIGDEPGSVATLLLVLGTFLTAIGTFWTQLRGAILRALPEFPGKSRLPPYLERP